MITRLIYASQASFDLAPDELVELLETSRSHNDRAGLSGMLLYSSQSFLQLLEGDATAVEATYERIRNDERHQHLRELRRQPVPAALFPNWTMGFEHVDDEELADSLPGFTAPTEYPLVNPDLITNAEVAQTLFKLYAKNRAQ